MSTLNTITPAFLRLSEVLKLIPIGKSTLWAMVKAGIFPQPVKLSAKITAWRMEDVREWIEQFHNPPEQSANQ